MLYGGSNARSNLVAACAPCNNRKKAKVCPASVWTTRFVSWGRLRGADPWSTP